MNLKMHKFVNVIKVNGNFVDLFFSDYPHDELGGSRALVEQVTGNYYPESDIRILSLHSEYIDFIEKE
jgi:hypothetical protein